MIWIKENLDGFTRFTTIIILSHVLTFNICKAMIDYGINGYLWMNRESDTHSYVCQKKILEIKEEDKYFVIFWVSKPICPLEDRGSYRVNLKM